MFDWGKFTSHSGLQLDYKINCDDLTDNDLDCLAEIVASKIIFDKVYGIPRGGQRFAAALQPFARKNTGTTLIVDDVLTTGSSILTEMAKHKYDHNTVLGVVIFSRTNKTFNNIIPIFNLNPMWIS